MVLCSCLRDVISLQAHNCTDSNLSKKMFLPLAEKMTKKYVDEGKIEAEAGTVELDVFGNGDGNFGITFV